MAIDCAGQIGLIDEPIRLTKLLPEAQLCELRRLSSSGPSPTSPEGSMAVIAAKETADG